MTTASTVLTPVFEALEDTANAYYTVDQGVVWLTEAQYATAMVRPDLSSDVQSVQLAQGCQQTLPAGTDLLLGVGCNMGVGGATPGKAIRGPVSRKSLEAINPDWRTDTANATVKMVLYNPAIPLTYWVYPAQPVTPYYIEIEVRKVPTALANSGSSISLSDLAIPALRQYVLASFLSRSSERTPNWTKAGAAFQQFFNLLSVEMRAKMAWDARLTEHRWLSQPTA